MKTNPLNVEKYDVVKGFLVTVFILLIFVFSTTLFAWYYNITCDDEEKYDFGKFSVSVTWNYAHVGRAERYVVKLEITNKTSKVLEINGVRSENNEFFLSNPKEESKYPVFILPGKTLTFFYIGANLHSITIILNNSTYKIETDWIVDKVKNAHRTWTLQKIQGFSKFLFWVFIMLYIIKRAKSL